MRLLYCTAPPLSFFLRRLTTTTTNCVSPFSLFFFPLKKTKTNTIQYTTLKVKILLYTLYTASEDVETQKMGITSIVWPGSTTNTTFTDDTNSIAVDKVIFMKRVYENLPVRTCSIHMCLPDTPFYQMMKSLMILTMSTYRKRMKFHVGTLHTHTITEKNCVYYFVSWLGLS